MNDSRVHNKPPQLGVEISRKAVYGLPLQAGRARTAFVIGILFVIVFMLGMALTAFERVLTLWERAQATGPLATGAFITLLALLCLGTVAALWWLFGSRRGAQKPAPIDEDTLAARLDRAAEAGIDTQAARNELAELDRRRALSTLYVAVFGRISAGKSSLIRALAPGADAKTDVIGGTTSSVKHYAWSAPTGNPDAPDLLLADSPGLQNDAAESEAARAEAFRAHVVLYVCDGDLTAGEHEELRALDALAKPMVVALNKADQYSDEQRRELTQHLATLVSKHTPVVQVSAGGTEIVERVAADGTVTEHERERPANLEPLRAALRTALQQDPTTLAELRDTAVFALAAHQLDAAERAHRQTEAAAIVARHTRAAIVGALAAISPGSDLVIQGAIGTRLVRSLCELFDVRARDLDIDALLKAAGGRARKSSALILAVAGNGLKAFPGIGTVGGGLAHAVAYGLLFDAFGNALVRHLEQTNTLKPEAAADAFADELANGLAGPLASRARRIARMALDARADQTTKP